MKTYLFRAAIVVFLVILISQGISNSTRDAHADDPITFTEHTIADFFDGANSVFAIDLDSDGDMDVLGAAVHADAIDWWENDGNEGFTQHNIGSGFDGVRSLYAIDLDDDGDIDVLGAAANDGEITWWENDGNENFTEHNINMNYNFHGADAVYAIDLDSDGDEDVIGGSDQITWWENDGNENFIVHVIDDNILVTRPIFATDLDNDGDIDVVGNSDRNMTWWENDGSENFTTHTITETTGFSHVADLDSDGDLDILGIRAVWWENDGNENFIERIIVNDQYFHSADTADLDDDGDLDILSGDGVHENVVWWENDGNENFTAYVIDIWFDEVQSVYAADVDSDGDIDVLGAAWGADDITWWEQDGSPPVTMNSVTLDQAHYNTTYSRYFYERNKDTVQATVNLTSIPGGTFNVVTRITDINGNKTDLPTQTISLSPGETRNLVFNWVVPANATLLDYGFTAEVRESGLSTIMASKSIDNAFMVIDVPVQELEAIHSQCFSTGAVCATASLGVIPVAGVAANVVALGDTACQIAERANNGDVIGSVMGSFRVANAAAEVVHSTAGPFTLAGALTSAAHSAIGGLADCVESHLHDFVVSQCGPSGYTCLAEKVSSSIGSIFSKKTTVVVVSPSGSGSSSAMDSISAMVYNPPVRIQITDSDGNYVEFNSSGQVVVDGVGMIYEIGTDTQMAILEGQGSYKDIKLTGLTNSSIDVNVLQVTEDGAVALATYENISTTLTSIATIHLATNQTNSDLQLDIDGNGSVDQVMSPTNISYSPSAPTGLVATMTDTEIDLSWNVRTNATGYKIYYDNDGPGSPYAYGDSASEGPSPIDVGNVTDYQLTNLPNGRYYLTVTAYDGNGNESGYSSEVMVSSLSNVYLPIIQK